MNNPYLNPQWQATDTGFDYREVIMTADAYAAALFLNSLPVDATPQASAVTDTGFDYREVIMTVDEYAAALFLDSLCPGPVPQEVS